MSQGRIESVKRLKTIYLEYEDGTMIAVPEDNALRVGTAFMAAVGKENFQWRVIKKKKLAFGEMIKKYFEI